MEAKELFKQFMEEYVAFFDQMVEAQKVQLEAVLSKQVKQVEQSAAALQTYLMKLDNMEKKRMEIQMQAGYGSMTFRQIVETVPQQEKQELEKLFSTLEQKVSDVAYYNKKSQEKVKLDLRVFGNEPVNSSATATAGGYTAAKKQVGGTSRSSVFETKA